jgi:preprotein translocase subunit SecG
MLSFLREQGNEKLSAQKSVESADRTKQTGTGALADAQGQEYFTVAAQNSSVRKSTILVAILFGIGLLCLWFMIKKSTPQTVSASPEDTDETKIEIAIARLTGTSSEMFGQMDQLVKKFSEFSNVLQIKVSELVKNPFELELFLSSLRGKVDLSADDVDLNAEMIRQQQMRQKAKDMQLCSIMQSEQGNCCMIDDKILYEGDLIKGFKVTQISDNFVKLTWQDTGDFTPSNTQLKPLEIVMNLIK